MVWRGASVVDSAPPRGGRDLLERYAARCPAQWGAFAARVRPALWLGACLIALDRNGVKSRLL